MKNIADNSLRTAGDKESEPVSALCLQKAAFSDDICEYIAASMILSRGKVVHQKVPLTTEIVREVLELKAMADAASGVAEMLDVNSLNAEGDLLPRSMGTLFLWTRILERLLKSIPMVLRLSTNHSWKM